ncbi:hypothetical protein Caka_3108 [Coraliomargarita akajimensis DSM 45221]|uniref:Uncharacterized protein n=1 Tax=Coraliomargarita akajimensis (strain DSM 45221 / IAM 15411 / JCM 23193 / KCTC 12865 / 04OKA010-24) TaxID=583355 RepID=D5EI81_CORAD|nr:hypothetical protein Caka_3108 [Coraliomargarita akajimensis DSM 45221]
MPPQQTKVVHASNNKPPSCTPLRFLRLFVVNITAATLDCDYEFDYDFDQR